MNSTKIFRILAFVAAIIMMITIFAFILSFTFDISREAKMYNDGLRYLLLYFGGFWFQVTFAVSFAYSVICFVKFKRISRFEKVANFINVAYVTTISGLLFYYTIGQFSFK